MRLVPTTGVLGICFRDRGRRTCVPLQFVLWESLRAVDVQNTVVVRVSCSGRRNEFLSCLKLKRTLLLVANVMPDTKLMIMHACSHCGSQSSNDKNWRWRDRVIPRRLPIRPDAFEGETCRRCPERREIRILARPRMAFGAFTPSNRPLNT